MNYSCKCFEYSPCLLCLFFTHACPFSMPPYSDISAGQIIVKTCQWQLKRIGIFLLKLHWSVKIPDLSLLCIRVLILSQTCIQKLDHLTNTKRNIFCQLNNAAYPKLTFPIFFLLLYTSHPAKSNY